MDWTLDSSGVSWRLLSVAPCTLLTTVCVPSRYAGILTTHLLQRTNIIFVFAFACWVGLLQIKFEPVHSQPLSQWHRPPPPSHHAENETTFVRKSSPTFNARRLLAVLILQCTCYCHLNTIDIFLQKSRTGFCANLKHCAPPVLFPTKCLFGINCLNLMYFLRTFPQWNYEAHSWYLFKAKSHPKAALRQKCTFSPFSQWV